LYGDPLETDAELDYLSRYFKLKYWNDLSAYKDSDGKNDLPEMLNAMLAMRHYDDLRAAEHGGGGGGGGKKPEDRLD